MSRQSTAAQRNLTLTEELEKLEQSITLTLQEIDHNFSRAHRIVTTSILPIVDQYAENSKNVWEGSKFWKQFFEASANVSLSGYEEPPPEDETITEPSVARTNTPSTSTYGSPPQAQDATLTPTTNQHYVNDNSTLSPSPSHSTPRPHPQPTKPPKQPLAPTTAPYTSPLSALKREHLPTHSPTSSTLPSTPRQISPNTYPHSSDPQSSPFAPPSTARTAHRTPRQDILLHRVLDKTYRIQATPHSTARHLPHRTQSPEKRTEKTPAARGNFADDIDSSPPAAPELRAEIFGTPARKGRVPGLSVLTPHTTRRTKGGSAGGLGEEKVKGKGKQREEWDSESDDDDGVGMGMGMSPPKTMQFFIPKPALVRTPAREASKRIVEDLLLSAGGDVTDELDEESPSVVKRGGLLEEDTF